VTKGRPLEPPRADEPPRLVQAIKELGLQHVVITSVTRDDLPDGGARYYAQVVRTIRENCPRVKVELLVPDFCGSLLALTSVLDIQPDILAHNLETVPRLYFKVRRGADYRRSLGLLTKAKKISPRIITKSGLMLGLGEEAGEVEKALQDLREAGCDMLTLGQYLAPSLRHVRVARYVPPDEFVLWRFKAQALGFKSVAAGPLIRSSYKASAFFRRLQ
jgi:lipoic acid synthetase